MKYLAFVFVSEEIYGLNCLVKAGKKLSDGMIPEITINKKVISKTKKTLTKLLIKNNRRFYGG